MAVFGRTGRAAAAQGQGQTRRKFTSRVHFIPLRAGLPDFRPRATEQELVRVRFGAHAPARPAPDQCRQADVKSAGRQGTSRLARALFFAHLGEGQPRTDCDDIEDGMRRVRGQSQSMQLFPDAYAYVRRIPI